MIQEVTTAVIFASGGGSRMLPVTAAVQKELLPILNRPVIDYLVSDCIAAGISHIIFVIRPDSHGLQDYYTGNIALERQLDRLGKHAALNDLVKIHDRATFSFVEQPENAGYGTAVPLMVAAPHLPSGQAVFVAGGDDFIWHADGHSETAQLIQEFKRSGAHGAISAIKTPKDQLHRWGVLATHTKGDIQYLDGIVEKPAPQDAPSDLINLAKYIITEPMLNYLDNVRPNPKSGELYLTDAIAAAAQDLQVVVSRSNGMHLDSGNTANWLKANLVVASSDPELSAIIKNFSS